MKKLNIATLALALVAAPASQAAWTLVNDFEAGVTTGITLGNTDPLATGNGDISVIADPANASNMVLQLDPGTFANGTDTNNTWFVLPFADVTTTGTLYTRFYLAGPLVDIVMGTSHVAEPGSYGDYSAIARVELDTILDYHDGSYTEVIGSSVSAGTWYDLWIAMDVTANTYDVWIKGTGWPSATKVATGADFRSNSVDPQNRMYCRMSTGNLETPKSFDKVLFDNVWVDTTAKNISIPSAADPQDPLSGGSVPQDNGSGNMSNLSTNTSVGAGGLTTGFVVVGDNRRVMIRAVGPGLGALGVPGTMADPMLEIKTNGGATSVATGDDWGDESNAADILVTAAALGAFGLPVGSADAVIMMSLDAGVYTATVNGKAGGTGQAIIEVYVLE